MTRYYLLPSISICLAVTSPSFAQDSVSTDTQPDRLSEILVTAQRRSENIQDVPVAVTAFSNQQLVDRQIDNVVDIMTTVPNLHASNNIGQGSAVTAFIRGVGETKSIPTIDTPVGFYLDDVYIARQGVNNVALIDVESLEVLRGPQGTLYGRNSSAGAIKVTTRKPDPSGLEFIGEASYGRFDEWLLKATTNIPISETLAVRVNGLLGDDGGDALNIFDNSRVNDTAQAGARAALRWLPASNLTIDIAADYGRSNENGTYAIDISGILRPTTNSLRRANSGIVSKNIAKSYGANSRIEWDISDSATITSITAWRGSNQRYNWDLSDQPVPLYIVNAENSGDQFSQEFQVTGETLDDRLTYVAGLLF